MDVVFINLSSEVMVWTSISLMILWNSSIWKKDWSGFWLLKLNLLLSRMLEHLLVNEVILENSHFSIFLVFLDIWESIKKVSDKHRPIFCYHLVFLKNHVNHSYAEPSRYFKVIFTRFLSLFGRYISKYFSTSLIQIVLIIFYTSNFAISIIDDINMWRCYNLQWLH